jgi:anti-anti-sigma factor
MLRLGKLDALMRDGVTVVNPDLTYVENDVEVGPDTIIEPGVSLRGTTRVGRDCHLQSYSTIDNSVLGDRVTVRNCSLIVSCEIGSGAVIGPFAHLRDGAVIEPTARIGNFVEVKKSRVGRGTKALHLTYLGDATLGENVNVGAGTVTCNYDGEKKHPTTIEDRCFIGSGTMLVAPVRVGKGSYIGAGSTITEDVPPESLAIARAKQVNKEGWVRTHASAEPPSTITLRQVGSVIILDVTGRLTMGKPIQELRERIRETVQNGSKKVIVNLAHASYVDSSGLGGLVAALTTLLGAGGQLRLSGIPNPIYSILEATHLERAFEIHPHEAAALESFTGAPPA